jgi:penicillin-binding protein 2
MPKTAERLAIDRRLLHLRAFLLCLAALLGGALWFFQIVKGDQYVELASQNRLRILRLPAPRGEIVDRDGAPLGVNVRTFEVQGYPMDLLAEGNLDRVVQLLRRHGIPAAPTDLKERIERQYVAPYRAVAVASNLTLAQIADLVSDPAFGNLLFPFPVWRRVYPAGPLAVHVVGYAAEISREELEADASGRYRGGDVVGKSGVESTYEDLLRGEVGEIAVEVDSRGRRLREVGHLEPRQGKKIRLTIDLAAQRFASELMGDRRGAIVALDVRDGAVRVLYSSPSYDSNPLAWGISAKEWGALLGDRERPMMNRAMSGAYPPGSTFKAVTATAGLEERVVSPQTTVYCPGAFTLGNRTFRCWRHSGHGSEALLGALRDSCDVYFYQVGAWLGVDRLLKWAERFGVGRPTGIDLPGESSGNLGGREWKRKRFGESWYKGDTVNYAIGQGYLLMTPLQLARTYAAVANGGRLVVPHVYADVTPPAPLVGASQGTIRLVEAGLVEVAARGTGRAASGFGVSVAGKTGTAQNPHGEDHAWFAGYAPAENPRYAAVVLVEQGGHGASVAAPLVGKLLAFLVEQDRRRERR